MDAFLYATTWHYSTFMMSGSGDIWRVWFNGREPNMERLTDVQISGEYSEAVAKLRHLEQTANGEK